MPKLKPDPNPRMPYQHPMPQEGLSPTLWFGTRSLPMNGSGSRTARTSGSGRFASTGRKATG